MFPEIFLDNYLLLLPLLLLPILPNLWSIWHIYTHTHPTAEERMAWLVAQIMLPVIGGIGYFCIGRKHALKARSATKDQHNP